MPLMKRDYVPPSLTKYRSPAELPDHLRHLLVLEPATIHEFLNLLQVITSECELLQLTDDGKSQRLRAISEAAFQLRNRFKDELKKIA